MFYVSGGTTFKRNEDGTIDILRNGSIIVTLTQDDWISVITHMSFNSKDLAEIHRMAEILHTGTE